MIKLAVCFLIWFIPIIYGNNQQSIVPFDCQIREGNFTRDIDSPSTISCESDETLVSCGISGWDEIQGTYIDPSNSNTCIVRTSTSNVVTAIAWCCTFPKGSITEINTIINNNAYNKIQIVTKCPDGSTLTGCQVNYQSGITNNIRGSYPGPQRNINKQPPSLGIPNGINTENQCIAESRSFEFETKIGGGAQCLKTSSNYELGIYPDFNLQSILDSCSS